MNPKFALNDDLHNNLCKRSGHKKIEEKGGLGNSMNINISTLLNNFETPFGHYLE